MAVAAGQSLHMIGKLYTLTQLAQLRVGMIGQLVAAALMDQGLSELRMSDLGM